MPILYRSLPWLLVLMGTGALVACGGGDDDPTPVDPSTTVTNLAYCHNPSMYTLGSHWSITWAANADHAESRTTGVVLAPPADWDMPIGTVVWAPWEVHRATGELAPIGTVGRISTFVRLAGDHEQTLLYASWQHFASGNAVAYTGSVPAESLPIALADGQTHQGAPHKNFSVLAYPPIDANGVLTYVGRESMTLPAGTVSTCHTISRRLADGVAAAGEMHAWMVAEGPYKGLQVKTTYIDPAKTITIEAKALSAHWK
ncbi:hypothetical protein FVQ98_02695 [Ottowia sp. GY511]|uniref:DUF3047 domain-containing protein n=1 Tax=Ottowia flava TaxID=2675430 RepID=A0ABW4KSD2_9BURK|nr:hypothetical protein [Ottowia sp. GY511]TXK32913.1 hypothetical protein FVQ98_02695 [Ottowia sp. GY511]